MLINFLSSEMLSSSVAVRSLIVGAGGRRRWVLEPAPPDGLYVRVCLEIGVTGGLRAVVGRVIGGLQLVAEVLTAGLGPTDTLPFGTTGALPLGRTGLGDVVVPGE